jgi:hypothetical protein
MIYLIFAVVANKPSVRASLIESTISCDLSSTLLVDTPIKNRIEFLISTDFLELKFKNLFFYLRTIFCQFTAATFFYVHTLETTAETREKLFLSSSQIRVVEQFLSFTLHIG